MKVVEELRALSEARFLAMYTDLAQNGFGPLDSEVAKQIKFRPQAIRKLPFEQRARRARAILISRGQAELCYELFGSWLIKERLDLVTGFLDGTGVPHEKGMLEDLENNRPDVSKLDETVAKLDAAFDPADVTLYLALAAEQWPLPELDALWRARSAAGQTA
jgi:hypothetical protein